MVTLLAKLFIRDHENVTDSGVRQAYGMLCGIVGIFFNLILFTTKALAGFFSHSIAITADAFNNLSDAASSIITLAGFKMAGQKPDSDHPFGHGRIEYISGLLVSILIVLMGFELVKSSVSKIFHPEVPDYSPVIIGILVFSILVKCYMALYNRSIGSRIGSVAMKATAIDSLSDMIATTVVLIGTIVSAASGIIIDGYCGVLVGMFILYSGFVAAKDTISPLLGQPPEPELVQQINDIVLSYDDVTGIHDLIVHNYGSDDAADFVEEKILPNAEKTMAVLTEQEQTAARLLLSALIGFLAAEAPMDEQSFPLMMELLNCMEGEKEDGCQDAVDSLFEDAACNTRRHEEYYSNYQRYQLMQVDKTRVILACRIIINDLLGKLYRYDYRFGYNLLLDEENSIEKKLHTPVREEWEAEDYEFSDC